MVRQGIHKTERGASQVAQLVSTESTMMIADRTAETCTRYAKAARIRSLLESRTLGKDRKRPYSVQNVRSAEQSWPLPSVTQTPLKQRPPCRLKPPQSSFRYRLLEQKASQLNHASLDRAERKPAGVLLDDVEPAPKADIVWSSLV